MVVKAGFGNMTDWAVRLREGMLNQNWNPKFMPRVLPQIYTHHAGGFEFEPFFTRGDASDVDAPSHWELTQSRWRRVPEAARLDPPTYCRNLARRSELQFSAEPTCVPIARNVSNMYLSLKNAYMSVGRSAQQAGITTGASAVKYVKAAERLLERHESGEVWIHGRKQRVNGDFTRLRYADGITEDEEDLLRLYRKSTRCLAGGQEMRRTFLPKTNGFRIVYGDCIFLTITPDRRHSSLVWRFHRARRNDTFLQDYDGVERDRTTYWRRKWSGPNEPSLYHDEEFVEFEIDAQELASFPTVDECKAMSARDPLSTVLHYDVCIRGSLSLITGLRMCFHCPNCSVERVRDDGAGSGRTEFHNCGMRPCQNKFGRNGRALGGCHALADGLCGATEHQGNDTPHFHGFISLATPYRHKSLQEIQQLIEKKILKPESVKRYVEHMSRTEHFDQAKHDGRLDELESDWKRQQAGAPHLLLSMRPTYLKAGPTSSSDGSRLAGSQPVALPWEHPPQSAVDEDVVRRAIAEGQLYKGHFEGHVQEVFSRTQHHWHALQDGQRVPQHYCRLNKGPLKKGKAQQKRHGLGLVCKQDFPQRLNEGDSLVICPGLACKFKLKVQGRKNMLSAIFTRRKCPWLSGTTAVFAAAFQSNTHIAPNYRVPLTKASHDARCNADCLREKDGRVRLRRLCVVAQRAMRMMSGYFGGYICKRQPVGKFQLRTAQKLLPKMTSKLQLMSISAQKAQLVNRLYNILEGRGKLRTGAEETNLAANYRKNNESHAEFLTTFTPAMFDGADLISRIEEEVCRRQETSETRLRMKRRRQGEGHVWYRFSDVYGLRPNSERVLYLSPYEFVMQWEVFPLQPPPRLEDTAKKKAASAPVYKLTRWLATDEELAALVLAGEKVVAGVHYEVNESFILSEWQVEDRNRYLLFPRDDSVPGLSRFRSQYLLRRRLRPVVPCISGPMPTRGVEERERRAQLLSLYMRPWTLIRSFASPHVPHLGNLDLVLFQRWPEPCAADGDPVSRLTVIGNADTDAGTSKHCTEPAPFPTPSAEGEGIVAPQAGGAARLLMLRRRCSKKTNLLAKSSVAPRDWDWRKRSYDEAWRRYIRGNVVSQHAVRLIKNFLQVIAGTGKHASEYDLSGTTHRRRDDFGDAGHRMSVGEIHEMLKPEAKKQPKLAELQKEASAADEGQDKKRRNYISARIESDFVMVDTLDRLVGKALKTTGTEPVEAPASAHHRPLPGGDGPSAPTQKKTADNKKTPRKHPNVYTRNYRKRHSAWRNELDRERK